MIKEDLIDRLKEQFPQYTKETLIRVVDVMLDTIIDGLAEGYYVKLQHFGAMFTKTRPNEHGFNLGQYIEKEYDRPKEALLFRFRAYGRLQDAANEVLNKKGGPQAP